MDAPAGFAPFASQGPFLEHVGPVLWREDGDSGDGGPVFGLRVEQRHTNHRGTVQGGLLSTFVDFAMGRAIDAESEDGKDRATVSLTGRNRSTTRRAAAPPRRVSETRRAPRSNPC